MLNYDDHKKEYYSSGNLKQEVYYLQGRYHRIDGPAIVSYYPSGEVKYEQYRVKGSLHRLDGPAFIRYSESGLPRSEAYYVNGHYINQRIHALRCWTSARTITKYILTNKDIGIALLNYAIKLNKLPPQLAESIRAALVLT